MKSIHNLVIEAIDKKWPKAEPFAIWELRDALRGQASVTSITRILNKLIDIKLIVHSNRGFEGRHYRVSVQWTTAAEVVQKYEYAKVLKI